MLKRQAEKRKAARARDPARLDSRLLAPDSRLLALRAPAHLSSGGAFLCGALCGLRFSRGRRLRGGRLGLLATAQALGGGAQAPADALGLRLLAFAALCFGIRLGARIELAANQLHLRDFGAVALAVPDAEEPCVAAGPIGEARGEVVEQLRDDFPILQILHDETPRVERAP